MSAPPSARAVRPRRFPDWRAWPVIRRLRGGGGDVDHGGGDWVNTVLAIGLVVGLGIVVGIQYLYPDKRVLAVLATTVIFGIAWRIDLVSGIGVLVLALPYPRGTVFGSTNLAMVLLLLIIWLLRASLRSASPPHRTPVDQPVVALLLSFVVSFYNIENGTTLGWALENFLLLLACIGMFYLIVNNVRRPEQLERLHAFQCASITLVCLLGVYEVRHPNGILVPGWIGFNQQVSEAINLHNVRIGGPFFDFELLSEYCAMNLLLLLLKFARARSGARKALFGGLFVLTSFVMFATVTRGGLVALGVGIAYLAWMQRKRFSAVTAGIALVAVIVGLQAMNFYVAHFTYSGDLLGRLLDAKSLTFTHGMPSGRAELWASAFKRMMEHPFIGHGPYYTIQRGLGFWYWPHNGYLYIGNLVGLIGLGFYLWLLARLWRLSRPLASDLHDANYARAYLNIARVQLVVFIVDQTKIDFMRNPTYQFQVWLFFAYIVAAYQASRPPAPAPARA
jgi:O-antigen ligase